MKEYSYTIFYRMLDTLRKRPGTWIGKLDIRPLRTYIDGYLHAIHDFEDKNEKAKTVLFPLDFQFMHEFAKIKTDKGGSSMGWANLILEECEGDGKAALERFFEYFDEFRELKAVSIRKAVLTEENILANDNMLYARCHEWMEGMSPQDIEEGDDRYECWGESVFIKKPEYDSPKAVYLIELSDHIGFIYAVETDEEVKVINYIFCEKQLTADKPDDNSPERVFGRINNFVEMECAENPDFGKPVRL